MRGQNIIGVNSEADSIALAANPAKLTETDFSEFIWQCPDYRSGPDRPEVHGIVARLETQVVKLIAGSPWMPFQHTFGISGYETYFNHPDEMFYALALALPHLSLPVAETAKGFLAAQLPSSPPYSVDGFDNRAGKPREAYDVPPGLRLAGRGKAGSAFGVYACWAYCHYADDAAAAKAHWPAVVARMRPLIEKGYQFDIRKTDYSNDEAEKLNGDLAGLVGLARLARINGDRLMEKQAAARAFELLELRVNLERVNPAIVQKSNSSSKHLHHFKLARYCDLAPEIAEALRRWSDDCGAARLKSCRESRNGWHLAFGERMIGGENYANPAHLPRALFAGAALVEQLPAEQLASFLDVPWCGGDLYFIEKCAYALWAGSGRAWKKLP